MLRDSSPVVILTTSAVVDDVTEYARAERGQPAPRVVEVDALDLDSSERDRRRIACASETLRICSTPRGRRGTPAGVMVSHRNLIANLEQVMSDYFEDRGKVRPADTTVVSWLPFYHDMGLILGICAPILAGRRSVLMSPMSFLQRPARWMQLLAQQWSLIFGGTELRIRIGGAPNVRRRHGRTRSRRRAGNHQR